MAITRLGTNSITGLPDGIVSSASLASGVGGKVLQVQSTSLNGGSTINISSTSFTDIGLSDTITPSATSSKIMISAMVTEGASSSSDGSCILRCLRDSTPIAGGTASGSRISSTTGRKTASADANTINSESITWIDTPSTTSQVTYKVQFASRGGGSGTAYIGQTANDGNDTENQRTSCNLTLFEIGA